ncbi:MAS protein, partial [Rhinopomastus cyanomelas]|nr:MAS protein [Rhinopomastus cyanomelas]
LPTMTSACPTCWSQPRVTADNSIWPHRLPRPEDTPNDWPECETGRLSQVPVTLLICLFGLVGNGAVVSALGSRVHRSPIAIYILNLAVADSAFLLSIAVALVVFYSPEGLCRGLGSRGVTAALNIAIVSTFTASIYLLTALSAATALSPSELRCRRSQRSPALVCALLWAMSFLLTITLYFCPAVLSVVLLSFVVSVLALLSSALTLLVRVLCCSWPSPPRKLWVVVLLVVFFFPFFTADFGYWVLLRLFGFSVFVFNTSLLLACVNSSVNPVIYFLVGSCVNKFSLSVRAALQRVLEEGAETQNQEESPGENTVE